MCYNWQSNYAVLCGQWKTLLVYHIAIALKRKRPSAQIAFTENKDAKKFKGFTVQNYARAYTAFMIGLTTRNKVSFNKEDTLPAIFSKTLKIGSVLEYQLLMTVNEIIISIVIVSSNVTGVNGLAY